MTRRGLFSVFLGAAATLPGCALIFDGGKNPEDRDYSRVLWGWLILDILLTGLIGLIIDFATGAIYARKGGRMGGLVSEVRLCPEATEAVLALGRPRRAGQFLAGHVASCAHCSDALVRLAPATIAVESICRGHGEVVEEAIATSLAPGQECNVPA